MHRKIADTYPKQIIIKTYFQCLFIHPPVFVRTFLFIQKMGSGALSGLMLDLGLLKII